MNTILDLILLVTNGAITGAAATGAYPSLEACHADVADKLHQIVPQIKEPETAMGTCVDYSSDLAKLPKVERPPTVTPAPGQQTTEL
jgi:hypothetical protein